MNEFSIDIIEDDKLSGNSDYVRGWVDGTSAGEIPDNYSLDDILSDVNNKIVTNNLSVLEDFFRGYLDGIKTKVRLNFSDSDVNDFLTNRIDKLVFSSSMYTDTSKFKRLYIEGVDALNTKKNIKIPDWLNKASFTQGDVIIKDGRVRWEGGYWDDGIWEDGEWIRGNFSGGIWRNGVWNDGIFSNGTWENGLWINGLWEDGVWQNGTWKNGEWNDGIWVEGTWENGVFKGGSWKNGIWRGGTWENGTWENGTWENGWFVNGTWLKGEWKNGIWQGGVWKADGHAPTNKHISSRTNNLILNNLSGIKNTLVELDSFLGKVRKDTDNFYMKNDPKKGIKRDAIISIAGKKLELIKILYESIFTIINEGEGSENTLNILFNLSNSNIAHTIHDTLEFLTEYLAIFYTRYIKEADINIKDRLREYLSEVADLHNKVSGKFATYPGFGDILDKEGSDILLPSDILRDLF